jgi:hypothetical protein
VRYTGYYRHQVRWGKLVILDNPVHEDVPNDLDRFLTAVFRLKPPVVILPDIIDDIPGTIWSAQLSASRLQGEIGLSDDPEYRPELMVVPHGFTTEEFIETAYSLVAIPGVRWIGITLERRLKDDPLALARRRERVLALTNDPRFNNTKFHLLGLSEQATELSDPAFARVTSVDTSKFVVLSLTSPPVYPPAPIAIKYPGREGLGPRSEYFQWRKPTIWEAGDLRNMLRAWSVYAERDEL